MSRIHLPYPENLYKAVFEDNYPSISLPPDLNQTLTEVLSSLTPREQEVIFYRHQMQMTLQEISDLPSFHVTKEMVRQILRKAYRKLRHPVRARKLRYGLAENARLEEEKRVAKAKEAEAMAKTAPLERVFRATPICDFDLSTRSWHSLTRAGLLTAGDVLDAGEEKLLSLRNMGRRSVDEITDKIFNAPRLTDVERYIHHFTQDQLAAYLLNFAKKFAGQELTHDTIVEWLKANATEENPLFIG